MAEIHVEKKSSAWKWIIGVVVALLVIWALIELFDNDRDEVVTPVAPTAVVAPVDTAPAVATTAPAIDANATSGDAAATMQGDTAIIPVAAILAGPQQYADQQVQGVARVTGVPTDRGFWVEQDGQRMFALIKQQPGMERAIDVNEGQQIRLAGQVHTGGTGTVDGTLDPQSQEAVRGQAAYLVVDPDDITVLQRQ